jgi:hypothetical protein
MFITEEDHEFQFPLAQVGESRSRYWRLCRLSLPRPWYILTVEMPMDGEAPVRQTICVALDIDLVGVIEALGAARPVALTCIRPRSGDGAGHWNSWEVEEVWLETLPGGHRRVVFRNHRGQVFADLMGARRFSGARQRRLVVRITRPRRASAS